MQNVSSDGPWRLCSPVMTVTVSLDERLVLNGILLYKRRSCLDCE